LKQNLNTEKAPKGPRISDGDYARTVKRDEFDEEKQKINVSSLSSSSSSEEEKISEESSSKVNFPLKTLL